MASFTASKYRGKALARLLTGITLPLPGGGGVAIPDITPTVSSATFSAKNFAPYNTQSASHSFFFNWRPASYYVILARTDGAQLYPPTGDAVAVLFSGSTTWQLQRWAGGVASSTGFNNVAFSAPPAETPCALTLNVDHSISMTRLDTNVVLWTCTKAQMEAQFGSTFFTGTYVSAHADVSGTYSGSNITGMRAQGNAVPLTANSIVLQTGYRPFVDINYTGAGHTGYNMELRTVGGTIIAAKAPATITVVAPGHLTLLSPTTFTDNQLATTVVTRVYEVVNGTETGVFSDLTVAMPSRPATFGANLAGAGPYGALRTKADAFLDGYYQDTAAGYVGVSPGTPGKTDAIGWPLISSLRRQIGKPDTSGETMLITWDGNASVAQIDTTEGDSVVSAKTAINANSYSYVHTFTRSGVAPAGGGGPNSFIGVRFNIGATPPTNIRIYPANETDRTKYWADSYIAYAHKTATFSGAMRVMDQRNINGNGTSAVTWAMRTLPDTVNGAIDGEAIEHIIELCNLTGRNLWLPVPAYATDDYITQLSIAINTGANLSQGKPWSNGLAPGLKWYFERGNEVWNVQFANFAYDRTMYANRTGETRLGDSNGGVEQAFKEHAFQYKRMVQLVMAAIPDYANRVVRVMAGQLGGSMYSVIHSEIGDNLIDAFAVAPYFNVAGSAVQINNLSSKTPANIEPFMAASIDNVMGLLPAIAATAKSRGHRLITYEGGMDFAANNDFTTNSVNDPTGTSFQGTPWYLTPLQIFQFRTSPSFYRCAYRYLNAWKSQQGDEFNQYTDMGGTGDAASGPNARFQWGLKPYQGMPGPFYGIEALQDVIAGAAMRY